MLLRRSGFRGIWGLFGIRRQPGTGLGPRRLQESFGVQSVLLAIVFEGHLSIPPGPIHGVDIRVEENLIEMPDDDRQSSQDGFIKVDGGVHIETTAPTR